MKQMSRRVPKDWFAPARLRWRTWPAVVAAAALVTAGPGALPSDGGHGVAAVQNQVEDRRIQNRLELQILTRRRGTGEDEDAGANHGSDTECGQAPRTQ